MGTRQKKRSCLALCLVQWRAEPSLRTDAKAKLEIQILFAQTLMCLKGKWGSAEFGDYDNCQGHISTSAARDRVKIGGIDEESPCRIIWMSIHKFWWREYRFPRPLILLSAWGIEFGIKVKKSSYFPCLLLYLVVPDCTWWVTKHILSKVCSHLSPFSLYTHLCNRFWFTFSLRF